MGKKSDRCPLCGKKLRAMNGSMVCGDCCYVTSMTDVHIQQPYSNVRQPYPNAQRSYTQNRVNSTPPARPVYNNRGKNQTGKTKAMVLVITFVIVAVMMAAVYVALISADGNNDYDLPYTNIPTIDMENMTYDEEALKEYIDITTWSQPESELFRQFVSHVFEKDYTEVTSGEIAEICFMELGHSDNGYLMINYKLTDGETGTFYYDDISVDTSDLSCFNGLNVLHVEDYELDKGDLSGIYNLEELWCRNSFDEIAQLTDVEKLKSVGISSSLLSSGMYGIEEFSDITSLRINGRYIEDISVLSSLTQLKNLEILDGEGIEDFSVLYSMDQLETLYIDANKLRDIGFISDMKNLRELTIMNSIALNVDSLEDCKDTLEKLNLISNYQVTDYDVVTELTNLTELTLYGSSDSNHHLTLPDFSSLKNLKSLAISVYDDISNIDKLPWLEELTLYRVFGQCDLSKLTNLKSLNLIDMSIEASEINTMTGLTALEKVSLRDSYMWGNIQEFMNLPNLKEIDMTECTAGFDVSALQKNSSVQVINMHGATLKALVDNKWDYNAQNTNNINLNDHTDIFENYPALEELYISENTIEDISFVENLTELRVLDITNNYVTDLEPLLQLENFEAVMCYENPVTMDDGEGGMIIDEN